MVKYFIRTTGERILHPSLNQIDFQLLIDTKHNAALSFVEQIEYLAKFEDDVIIIEDDVILCKNFKIRAEEIIHNHCGEVISFFYEPNIYLVNGYYKTFLWNQCVYYPNKILKLLAKELRTRYNFMRGVHHDIIESWVFHLNNIDFYCVRPCLVQHMEFNTLIHKKCTHTHRTLYFIDYLDDLNIPYEQAKEHKQELIEYMNKHLEQVRKEMNIDG